MAIRKKTNPGKEGKGETFAITTDVKAFKQSVLNRLTRTLARDPETACPRDWWVAICGALNNLLLEQYLDTMGRHSRANVRRVYYLSLEYLMGRMLENNLVNAGVLDVVKEAIQDLGLNYEEIINEEVDMGLGNGGLGRLAACFLDSLATLNYPAIGYGIHYEFGLFKQKFVDGRQVETPDNWLHFGNPWHIMRPEYRVKVPLYGHVEYHFDAHGNWYPQWTGARAIIGVPWDIPIVGYGAKTINFLRLWESRSTEEFDLTEFNRGDYVEAVRDKALSETISKVLYPNDSNENGKELRLVQQYFFVCCSLHDIIRRYRRSNDGWDGFAGKVAMQLNDTHPAIAVAELMRILVDEEHLGWDASWEICTQVFAYTNHTLLPEALERWSVPLFEKVLPRHLQLIYEINRRFLEEVEAHWPGDGARKTALSIIEEGQPKMIRMAHLAVVGSHAVNGVAALHTELLKQHLFRDFAELYPHKFQNKTNGITPRRFLKACNPGLAALIDATIGTSWPLDLDELHQLEKYAEKKAFRDQFMQVKRQNKIALAEVIERECGVVVSPDALFDVQIKRLHEYKRQHLNLLHVLTRYRAILQNPEGDFVPRVVIFGAKAAPGYVLAKEIIYAINRVAEKINNDPIVGDRLKVVFLPNYRVTLAEKIIPAADLSEQISTAGKEASGTGNMKFGLNGALTIGTLDGANVEIREEVGDENIFIFGLTVDEVESLKARGYNSYDYYHANADLKNILDWLVSDFFTPGQPEGLRALHRSLLEGGDPFLVLADYEDYCATQLKVDDLYRDKDEWARKAVLNTARMGMFSSDRTIRQYADEIWDLKPLLDS